MPLFIYDWMICIPCAVRSTIFYWIKKNSWNAYPAPGTDAGAIV
jgi:hypothetical protein